MCSSILVSDYLAQATTQSLYLGWSLTGGSTIINNLDSGKKNYWFEVMSGKVLNFESKNQYELLLMY